MTTKTRYFVIASLLTLTVGLGVGALGYYDGLSTIAASRQGGPEELRFVPADAVLVAYADVQAIMSSPLRNKLRTLLPSRPDGQQEFASQTGIDIESDIDRVTAAARPSRNRGTGDRGAGVVLARGRFDAVKIEALMRDHGAQAEEYNGKRLIVGRASQRGESLSLAFLEPGLIAVGSSDMVRNASDLAGGGTSVTTNDSVMSLVRDFDSADAWAVGRFDALTARAQLPAGVGARLPPIQWFSTTATIGSGVRAVLKAEALDEQAATGLRDVVRGMLALAKLQASTRPEFEVLLRSVVLGGTGSTVSVAFELPSEFFDALGALTQGFQPRVHEPAR